MKIIKEFFLFLFCIFLSFGISNTIASIEESIPLHLFVLSVFTFIFYTSIHVIERKIKDTLNNNQE